MMAPARLVQVVAALAVAAATLVATSAPAFAGAAILGGGSGFAALEIDQWRADTARSPYNLSVNYVAQGSTFGRQQFSGGSFDFGASDIQYTQIELPDLQSRRCAGKTLAQCFVYVPVSAGGLAFMYNLADGSGNRINDLRLTRAAACKIFTGAITKWNDPELVATNPRLAGINRDIHPVIRADGAGESYVFSEFCIAVAPGVWNGFIAEQNGKGLGSQNPIEFNRGLPTSVWPQQGWGTAIASAPFADGVADYVSNPSAGTDAITYVAAGYAKVRSFPTASLQNAAGVFTQPDETNVTVALGYALPRGNGTFQLQFSGPDPRSYFPSTYSYVLAQTTGFDAGKGATLGRFLCYAISQGQVVAPQLRYARLSSALVDIAENAIVQIPGAPSKANCFVAGAPAPPPPPTVVGGPGGGGSTSPTGASGNGGTGSTAARAAAARANALRAAAANLAKAKANAFVAASGQLGASSAVAGESINSQLAREAGAANKRGTSDSTIWILLAGIVGTWVLQLIMARRRPPA